MKQKFLSLILVATMVVALALPVEKVMASDLQITDSENIISQEDMVDILEAINECNKGDVSEVIVNNEWKVETGDVYMLQNSYGNSKTKTHYLRVTKLGEKKIGFRVVQKVSYVITTETKSVRISSYSTSCVSTISGLTISRVMNDTINNSAPTVVASAKAQYKITQSWGGYVYAIPSVTVTPSGNVTFDCPTM